MKRIVPMDVAYLDAERPNTPPLVGVLIVLDPATAPNHFVATGTSCPMSSAGCISRPTCASD